MRQVFQFTKNYVIPHAFQNSMEKTNKREENLFILVFSGVVRTHSTYLDHAAKFEPQSSYH